MVSIGTHPREYRYRLYEKMREAQMMIACPMAWIDSHRKDDLQPFHNALTPADEMIPRGITVALGTDNICDYMVPLCEGDLWQELSLLTAGCRFLDLEAMGILPAPTDAKSSGWIRFKIKNKVRSIFTLFKTSEILTALSLIFMLY